MTVPPVRAPAKQRRSRETFEAVMVAAGSLIDDLGIEATTMEAIARHAGVSVGSVYRFFENRDALVATLAARWSDVIAEVALPQFAPESLQRDAEDVISDFVAGFAQALDRVPGARGLLAASASTSDADNGQLWTLRLEAFLDRYAPGLPPARRREAATTYETVTAALMARAARSTNGTERALQEIRAVLTGYTRQLAHEATSPRGPCSSSHATTLGLRNRPSTRS